MADYTKIYLSGPMTGINDFNYPAFYRAGAQLCALGYEVISPAREFVEGWKHSDYMRRAIQDLLEAECVALLPGWEESYGAQFEHLAAVVLGPPVKKLEEYL